VSQKHEFKYMRPILTSIAEIILTVPVSNAWPERGASKRLDMLSIECPD
jgi:hypothetical protein